MLLIPHVDVTSSIEFWVRLVLSKRQPWTGRAFGSWGLLEVGRRSSPSSEGRKTRGSCLAFVGCWFSKKLKTEWNSKWQLTIVPFPLVQMCNILARQLGEVEINGQAMSLLYLLFRWLHADLLAHTNITEFSTETAAYLKTWLMLVLPFIK